MHIYSMLRLDAMKCKVMHLGSNNVNYVNDMREGAMQVKLETSNFEKDLGVYVENEIKFSRHAELTSNKANSLMGMIKMLFTCIDKQMIICLFKV